MMRASAAATTSMRWSGRASSIPCSDFDVSRAAVLQMTSGIDPRANAATIAAAIADAARGGAAMLFTPEMSGLLDRKRDRATPHIVAEGDDPVLAAVREAAARSGIWGTLGSLAIRREDGR